MITPAEITKLWQEHASGLKLLVRARFGNQANTDPDDVVQDAFIKLSGQPQMPLDPVAWLSKTCRNLAIDCLRKNRRRRLREQNRSQQNWFSESDREQMNASTFSGEDVSAALQELNCQQRELLVAHLWNGMTFRQIASAFGMSNSAVHRKYTQGLAAMRKTLAEMEDSPCGNRSSLDAERAGF